MLNGLYIVATPIGNMGDISNRAIEILQNIDFIICENPKHSRKLMSKLGIKKKLVALHDYNEEEIIKNYIEKIKSVLKDVSWCNDAYQAMDGADAVAILTEWNEFRGLDLPRIKSLLKTPIVIDLRNIYNPEEMSDAGFIYSCVGRKR